jgi:hypothetical protein
MSINFNIFEAGLNGGTVVLTGNQSTTASLSGNFKGFRVANQCYITSILNQNNINVTSSVSYNGVLSNISGSQLNEGDTIAPYGSTTNFTSITLSAYSNRSQIVAYNTGSI